MINMSQAVEKAREGLKTALLQAVSTAAEKGQLPQTELPEFSVEPVTDRVHGDYTTNIAMASARAYKLPPRKIAETICENLDLSGTYFELHEVAGPGFINFLFKPEFYAAVLADIDRLGKDYGKSNFGQGKKVMVEFVSANPTGPMHMGNARGGALGDCLSSVLEWAGFDVYREFYVNDAGNQIQNFALSLEARYLQLFKGEEAVPFPEDGYHGEDIIRRAGEFAEIHGDKYVNAGEEERRRALVDFALPKNIQNMKDALSRYRITYDNWFFESVLHEDGELKAAIDMLNEKGLTYEKDGALWYKATLFRAEKDEVLIRSNGTPTYFAADIAYHYNKFSKRGFDICINIWGADHHGHVARLKGVMDALGLSGDNLHIVLMQLVRLTRGGEIVRMSKRTGKAISLTDLLEEVPVDAARFFFNLSSPNSQMEFDLDLAVEQSAQNPVYYVQYAHARICSILRNLEAEGINPRRCSEEELKLLTAKEEKELIMHLGALTDTIISAAKDYDPARVTRYCIELATLFHRFYNACRVKGEAEPLMSARLNLCLCVKTVLKNLLDMLKIEAPESM